MMSSPLSRRHLILGLAGALAACSRVTAKSLGVVTLAQLGVDRFTRRDQRDRLQRAFDVAREDGLMLVGDAGANYHRDGPLILDGVSFDGMGCAFTALSDGPQVLRCLGKGWHVANLRVFGASTRRASDNFENGIWVGDEGDHSATDFHLENVTVGSVAAGRGVGGAGIMVSNARRGRLSQATVRNSLSDGIHVTAGTTELVIENALVEDSGDDGVAVVSYRYQKRPCRAIRVINSTSRRSAARGLSVAGGTDVTFEQVRAEASAAAGIYFYGEIGFDTFGVARCQVLGAEVVGASTGRGMSTDFSNAAVIVGGREGMDMVDGTVLPRGASDCVLQDVIVTGAGEACTAAISLHEYAIRPRVTRARVRGMGRAGPRFAANGIEVGGRDVIVDTIGMTDVPGLAVVIPITASGDCRILAPTVAGSRLAPGPIKSYIYAEPAPALRQITVTDGRFSGGPDRLAISLLRSGVLRMEAGAR